MESGAAVSAFPENVGEVVGSTERATGFEDVTADGRASVQDQGKRRLKEVTEVDTSVNMDMRVAGCTRQWCQQGRYGRRSSS